MDGQEFLIRLVIAVLVFIIGEKVIALVKDDGTKSILNIILLLGVVLFVIFGNFLPIG